MAHMSHWKAGSLSPYILLLNCHNCLVGWLHWTLVVACSWKAGGPSHISLSSHRMAQSYKNTPQSCSTYALYTYIRTHTHMFMHTVSHIQTHAHARRRTHAHMHQLHSSCGNWKLYWQSIGHSASLHIRVISTMVHGSALNC